MQQRLQCVDSEILRADHRNVAVVLARGASKGLPKKNLKMISGMPLVIRAAKTVAESNLFCDVYISSDDEETLTIAEGHGIQTIQRPEHLSGDHSPSEDAVRHAIGVLNLYDRKSDIVAMIQPTSPFLHAEDLRRGITAIRESEADSSFSATEFHGFVWEKVADEWLERGFSRMERPMRQSLPDSVVESGAFYATTVDTWLLRGRFGSRPAPILIPKWRAIDIDLQEDLDFARHVETFRPDMRKEPSFTVRPLLVAIDFDGVLTNDMIHLNANGDEMVTVSRRDGAAIAELKALGIDILIVTREPEGPARRRAEKLGLHIITGADDKEQALKAYQEKHAITAEKTWSVGNTIADLGLFRRSSSAFVPDDAQDDAKRHATYTLQRKGGEHIMEEILRFAIGAPIAQTEER